MSDDYYFSLRLNPGVGGYWEAEIICEGERQVLRSYKLDNLMAEVVSILMEYRRKYG